MKKVYSVPQLAVYHIAPSALIADSPKVGINSEDTVDADKVETKKSDNWNLWGSDNDDE